jgi:hypothetical protein
MTILISNDGLSAEDEEELNSLIAFPDIGFNLEIFESTKSLMDSASKHLCHVQLLDGHIKISYKDW